MVKWNALAAVALGASVFTTVGLQGQQKDSTASPIVQTLTAEDYIEIQQLVARYAYAVDTHAKNGYAYADLFTADGTFGKTKGREELAALARRTQPERSGPAFTRHFLTNVIINTSPEGATGRQYLVALDVGEDGKPSTIVHGGHYDDVYVKTPQGWRFKSRTYVQSKLGDKPAQAAPAR